MKHLLLAVVFIFGSCELWAGAPSPTYQLEYEWYSQEMGSTAWILQNKDSYCFDAASTSPSAPCQNRVGGQVALGSANQLEQWGFFIEFTDPAGRSSTDAFLLQNHTIRYKDGQIVNVFPNLDKLAFTATVGEWVEFEVTSIRGSEREKIRGRLAAK
jgi:hypothetical protein